MGTAVIEIPAISIQITILKTVCEMGDMAFLPGHHVQGSLKNVFVS